MNKFSDVRQATVESRLDIGFSEEKQAWKTMKAHYDEHNLVINGHPVMEDWEDQYMRDLALIACSKGGCVVEVGFGMGISAKYIQDQNISKHIIVEANHEVYLKLLEFSKQHPKVVPLYGFWEEVLPLLAEGSIDGVLFDTYPLCEEEIHTNHFPFFKEAERLLKKGGVLTYYSDEIDSFSDEHIHCLADAGFKNVDCRVCPVNPPADCQYWKSKQILSPIIIK